MKAEDKGAKDGGLIMFDRVTPNYVPELTAEISWIYIDPVLWTQVKETLVKLVHAVVPVKVIDDGYVILSFAEAGRLGVCFNLNVYAAVGSELVSDVLLTDIAVKVEAVIIWTDIPVVNCSIPYVSLW